MPATTPPQTGPAPDEIELPAKEETERDTSPRRPPRTSPSEVRVAPPLPDPASFGAAFESRYAVTEIRIYIDESSEASRYLFEVHGDLTPAAAADPAVVAAGPRAIVEAFLMEEAATLGLIDLEDLEELYVELAPPGFYVAAYRRLIGGLRLEGARIQVHVDADGRIQAVMGTLSPIPDALYDALRGPLISRDEAIAIASADLAATGRIFNPEVHAYLTARPTPPYAVWRVTGGTNLLLDAVSGEVIYREPWAIP